MTYALVGLFKGDRFSYGRALVSQKHLLSFVSSRIGYELSCRERLEKLFAVDVQGVGRVFVDSICAIDRAVIGGGVIEKTAVFYIVDEPFLRRLECDLVIGLDVISWWGLVVDTVSRGVYSVLAKSVTVRY
jgi:hypothetical protein